MKFILIKVANQWLSLKNVSHPVSGPHLFIYLFCVFRFHFLLVTYSSLLKPVINYAEVSEGAVDSCSQNIYVTNKCDFKQEEGKKEYRPGGMKQRGKYVGRSKLSVSVFYWM